MGFTNVTKACNTSGGYSVALVEALSQSCNPRYSSASLGLALCFGLLCFCDCTYRWTAVVLVCLAMAFVSGYVPGYNTRRDTRVSCSYLTPIRLTLVFSVVSIAPSQTAAIASFSRIWAQVSSKCSSACRISRAYSDSLLTVVFHDIRFLFYSCASSFYDTPTGNDLLLKISHGDLSISWLLCLTSALF